MEVTQLLYNLGQSIWLHNITRDLLNTGTFRVIAASAKAGIDVDALDAQLEDEGARAFVKSWHQVIGVSPPRARRLRRPASQ
jgi:hypothetical protein